MRQNKNTRLSIGLRSAIYLCATVIAGVSVSLCAGITENIGENLLSAVRRESTVISDTVKASEYNGAAFVMAPTEISENPSVGLSSDIGAAVLYCPDTGEILYEENAHERRSIASTTKIMTAITALENGDLSKVVSVPDCAVGTAGSSAYLAEGESLTTEELLYALLLESANDAAVTLAYDIGSYESDGSDGEAAFVDMMNRKAAELKLTDSHFTNPHGLDDEDHYSSAYDLAVLTEYALKNEKFAEIVSTYKKRIEINGTAHLFVNHNRLLRSYDGCIGVKTGYTQKSGRCLVSAAKRDGITMIAVTLSDRDDWNDHKKLLDYGLSKYKRVTLCESKSENFSVKITGGSKTDIDVTNTEALSAVIGKSDSGEIGCEVFLDSFYYAPIKKGDKLGSIVYKIDGNFVGEVDLCATDDVLKAGYKKSLFERIADWFAD